MTAQLGSGSLNEPPAGLSVGLLEFLNWCILVKSNGSPLGVQNVRTSFLPPRLHRRGGAKTWQSSSIRILLGLTQWDENGGDSCDQASSPPQKRSCRNVMMGTFELAATVIKVLNEYFTDFWKDLECEGGISAIKCLHFQSFMFNCEQNRRIIYSFTKKRDLTELCSYNYM